MNQYAFGCVDQFVLQTSCLCVFMCIRVSLRLQSKIQPDSPNPTLNSQFYFPYPLYSSFSYSTVHCTFVCGFRFHWINLSRCPAENVLYLDKQNKSTAAWRLYISWHFHLAMVNIVSILISLNSCLCAGLCRVQNRSNQLAQLALNPHVFVFVSEWNNVFFFS